MIIKKRRYTMAKEEKKPKAEKKPKEEAKPEAPKEEAVTEAKPEEKPAEEPKEEKPAEKKEKPKEKPLIKPKGPNIVHVALFLHSADKEVNEANMKKVIDASGAKVDPAQIKALVSSLEGIDISEAVKSAAVPMAAPAAAPPEEKKKEESSEKKAEQAAAGLSSLFG